MPTRLLLEGPDIESLLARVRTEHGAGARIVSADKVRSGGVAGFFAKERFEVAVEVDETGSDDVSADKQTAAASEQRALPAGTGSFEAVDTDDDDIAAIRAAMGEPQQPAAPTGPVPGSAASLADLTALADSAEQSWRPTAAAPPAATPAAAAPPAAAPRAQTRPRHARTDIAPSALVPAATPAPAAAALGSAAAPIAPRTVSTEGQDFAQMLAALTGQVIGERSYAPGDAPSGPASPATDATAEAADPAEPFRPAPFVPPSAVPAAYSAVMDAVASGAITPPEQPEPAPEPEPVFDISPDSELNRTTAAIEYAIAVVRSVSDAASADASLTAADLVLPSERSTVDPTVTALTGLGLDVSRASAVDGEDRYSSLLAALADLPTARPPRARSGDVVVVVGELAHAMAPAELVARTMRTDPGAILVAGVSPAVSAFPAKRRISGPAEASRRAGALHRHDLAHLVVVDTPVDRTGPLWAREIADSVDAAAVFAVIDATRKTSDLRRFLTSLGRVDGLLVHNVEATDDPASVLDLGVPVATVDGRISTPAVWAGLLVDRLTTTDDDADDELTWAG